MKSLFNLKEIEKIAKLLQKGKIGILPTDTIYGIHASAWDKEAVERIYSIKKRESNKPFLVLISSIKDLDLFKITLESFQRKVLNKVWPGPVSVVFACGGRKTAHLRRGKNTLAFRFPQKVFLRRLLEKSGPLVSTSANLSGQKVATSVKEAQEIFGDQVDFFVNGGKLSQEPSTIISFSQNQVKILRRGKGNLTGLTF